MPGAKTTMEWRSESPEQTQRLAATLASKLRAGDLVALQGELGAGKTCFVRGLAHGLGLDPAQVSSPTFVIAHEYAARQTGSSPSAGTDQRVLVLVHIDAYRLRSADDLETIGWSEMLASRDSIIALEWPERIDEALPVERVDVRIEHEADRTRRITVVVPAALADRLEGLDSPGPAAARPGAKGRSHRCRTCGEPVAADSRTFPFCSERCRLADLGQWFRESYRVSRRVERDEELSD